MTILGRMSTVSCMHSAAAWVHDVTWRWLSAQTVFWQLRRLLLELGVDNCCNLRRRHPSPG